MEGSVSNGTNEEGLWRIVTGEETAPTGSEAEQAKFAARKDRALATANCTH